MGKADKKNSKTTKDEKRKEPEKLSDILLCLAVAVVLAILIKKFAADVYLIPSGSMEPTLHGRTWGGDRIFSTKLRYRFGVEPNRWDVVVFLFPFEEARKLVALREDTAGLVDFRGDNFIKRCVALPGETLRVMRGDLYLEHAASGQPVDAEAPLVKPPGLQQGIWIPVYREDFAEIDDKEFGYYWTIESGRWRVSPARTLRSEPGAPALIAFRSQTRFGELKGIPDRYVRRQVVTFRCPEDGCNGEWRQTVDSPKIVAHCPCCGRYLTERDVVEYGKRSGYPVYGQRVARRFWENGYSDDRDYDRIKQGDGPGAQRNDPWHFVPDLRVSVRAQLKAGDRLRLEILDCPRREDYRNRLYQAEFRPGEKGTVRVLEHGKPLPECTLDKALVPGRWYRLAFAHVDGHLRLRVDGELVLDRDIAGLFPRPQDDPLKTGIHLFAEGEVELDDIEIGRDIYYYTDKFNKHGDPETTIFGSGTRYAVKNGYLFFGDNCPASFDSRDWGEVPHAKLRGPAHLIWWPPHRLRLIE